MIYSMVPGGNECPKQRQQQLYQGLLQRKGANFSHINKTFIAIHAEVALGALKCYDKEYNDSIWYHLLAVLRGMRNEKAKTSASSFGLFCAGCIFACFDHHGILHLYCSKEHQIQLG